jgi:hypothetical protein
LLQLPVKNKLRHFYRVSVHVGPQFCFVFLIPFKPNKNTITPDELKKEMKSKIVELEIAMSLNRPNQERLKIYKELKELQYMLFNVQHSRKTIV